MRTSHLTLVFFSLFGLCACYKPEYASNADAHIGFRCHKSDRPACPPSLVCCLDGVCGDDLKDEAEGWCVTPPMPTDMAIPAIKYWPFPNKTMLYGGVYTPDPLSGYDSQMQWLCLRDDTIPDADKPKQIQRMFEPNDFKEQAVMLRNPLPTEAEQMAQDPMGARYQICPDKTAPDRPDVDVFMFKLASSAAVIAEIKYQVVKGDLDIALFRMDVDPDTGMDKPTVIGKDLSAMDNGCIEIPKLAAGTYYVVVRGVQVALDEPGKYTQNNYNLRVFTVDPMNPLSYSCMPKKDGGT